MSGMCNLPRQVSRGMSGGDESLQIDSRDKGMPVGDTGSAQIMVL